MYVLAKGIHLSEPSKYLHAVNPGLFVLHKFFHLFQMFVHFIFFKKTLTGL